MSKGSEWIFFQKRSTNGQQAYEKMLNIIIVGGMQIKTTMKYHLTLVRMTVIKKVTR